MTLKKNKNEQMKRDINSREDIHLLVSSFYVKVRTHLVLGPFFNDTIKNWDDHLERLTTFWESSIFLKTRYKGDPIKAHIDVDNTHDNTITEQHFGLWLNLWIKTIDELFKGDYAENAKQRARKMGTFIHLKLFEARG